MENYNHKEFNRFNKFCDFIFCLDCLYFSVIIYYFDCFAGLTRGGLEFLYDLF